MSSQPAILELLDGVSKNGSGWTARCPAHEDRKASLSISNGDNGGTVLFCHAGCETKDVLQAIGLTITDLAPPNATPRDGKGRQIVTAYDYRDESGGLLFQAVRMEPKDFRQRQPKEGGGWAWSVKDVRVVPYRLPDLTRAEPTELVFIPEGEKDCDRLAGLGLVATCNAGGAGKWKSKHAEHLRGRRVVILPDNDGPGRKHAESVAGSLQGVAESVKVLELPGLPDKGDVSDWLDADGTAEKLRELVDAAGEWEPDENAGPVVIHSDGFPLTDSGLAERFAQQHAEAVRYCNVWNKWLVWDGRRWRIDDTRAVDQLAKETARSILAEAAGEIDDKRRKDLVGFARSSESAARLEAMLKRARSEPPIPILPEVLDVDRWLLNCRNGTLDLRTGKLREHRRADQLTKLAPVEYHANADCPTWLTFLGGILRGNSELADFLQRFLGYCLTGDVSEQVLPILWGTGANGKSTFVGTALDLLGEDYAIKAASDFVLAKRGDHPTATADLAGKRFVACVETGEGRRLAEALIKELTGGDKIRARRMREDFWQFDPTHKLILATNHQPEVKGTDWAIWRRLRLVPFTVRIPESEQDKRLPEKLRDELPGILAWCVRGCLGWQRDGLGEPSEVTEATNSYRCEQDTLAGFLEDCCTVTPDLRAKAGDLLEAYRKWSGEKRTTQRALAVALRERGFEKKPSGGYVWWYGVGLSEGETA